MSEKPLSEVREEILTGDLLLFRGKGFVSWLIGLAGRTHYTHAAKADWINGGLYCCEVREFKGGRIVTLKSQVEQYPGRIDVFRANPDNRWPEYSRESAAEYMRNFAGCEYGYWSVFLASLLHMAFVRIFTRPNYTIESETGAPANPPYCSQACAMADRLGGGVDPVTNLGDRFTEPGDLSRSLFYRLMFTLSAP